MATGIVAIPVSDSPSHPGFAAPDITGREVNNLLKLFTAAQVQVAAIWTKLNPEEGQTMAEYAVVLAVITLGILVALTALSGGISNALNNVKGILP